MISVDIGGFPPFRHLDDRGRREALGLAAETSPSAGGVVYRQGERADAAYLVVSGAVRLTAYRSDESSLELAVAGPGDWLAVAETVLSGLYLAEAVAADPARLLRFPASGFDRLRRLPGTETWFLGELARRIYALSARLELATPGRRLARCLADEARRVGADIELTQERIAAAVGVTRETANRRLSRLQAAGLIRLGRGHITVLDRAGLSAIAEGEDV